MSLLPFMVIAGGGALALLLLRSRERIVRPLGPVVMVAAMVAALLIVPGQVVIAGGAGIATTDYLRLFLVLGTLVGLCLVVVGASGSGHRDAPAATLAILAASALALAFPDPQLAVLAATAAGACAVLVAVQPGGDRAGATAGIRVLRATVVAGTMAIAATAWIGRDLSELVAQPVVFGLAYLAVAVAVAIRLGAIPFHPWAARLTDTVAETSLPLVTVLGAASFAVVALAWTDASIAPLLVDLDTVRVAVLAIAIASILLASLAALIQDDIEHVVGYSIVGDAGVVMLAIAALEPEAWAPARTWILALVAARCAFAGWAAAARVMHATGRVEDLRGWAITSPILAIGFAAVVLGSIGLPGLAAFDARTDLVEFALGTGPLALLVFLGTLAPLIYYGRLAVMGFSRPRPGGEPPAGWRPVVGRLDLNDLNGWLSRTWTTNRSVVAGGTSVLMGLIAVAVMAGAFGVTDAAAALPPTLEQAVESFAPEEAPPGEEPLPSAVTPPTEESSPPEATPSGLGPGPSSSVPTPS